MSVLSTVSCALLAAVSAFTIVTAAGCGTDAKGVDDCRDIEQARCAAAKNCGIVDNVAECQNFYRDQCLHGLAVTPPGAAAVKKCVDTIRAAGDCAALIGTDTPPSECSTAPSESTSAQTTCEIVSNPERTSECSFLMPNAGGSGGSGGGGGTESSGGTDSSGGTTAAAGATADGSAG